MPKRHSRAAGAAFSLLLLTGVTPATAQPTGRYAFDLPAESLSQALRDVSTRTGRNVIAPGQLVQPLRAPPLSGSFTAEEAISTLLEGTGLHYKVVQGTVIVEPIPFAESTTLGGQEAGPAITVTGTRIRGAPVASPVIKLTQEQIREAGQGTLAEAVRTIPQNFGGGQNPGVGNNVPSSNGVNVGSAASVNLRGLGSDATLTLLDGHRLSYSASRQAIDISSIPLAAVDRIEIVPDGASALYGSDAVAGVVNVILRRDFDGIETSARVGTSTDGGDFEQRYGIVAGRQWTGGGIFAAYEFGRTTAVVGRDRSYTAETSPALTLFPFIRSHSLAVTAHQDLAPDLKLDVDGLYNNRYSRSSYALNPAGDIEESGARFSFRSSSFVIAPTLRWRPAGDWDLFLTGSYGQDHTHYDLASYFAGSAFRALGNCYCNDARSAEMGGDGTVIRLPAGRVKLAAGLGYRSNKLIRFNGPGADTNISKIQESYYGYGELAIPVVAPEQQLRFARSVSLSAALRYESYPGVGKVVTPKFGAIYAPSADLAFKGSWGKSFRAPTLYQQYQARNVVLAPGFVFGGQNLPEAPALLLQGGNPDLKPERATSWSATVDLHPRTVEGASFELSYFSTRYRDRVVTPILFLSQALSNPIYAGRLTFDPSQSLVNAVVASADSFANVTDAPFDPENVGVFIDDRNVNAGYQKITGLDLLAAYAKDLPRAAGRISGTLNATYLKSEQQLAPGQPILPLAGILFNPPHWRGRGGLSWSKASVTLTGDLNYIGGVKDSRGEPPLHVRGMTTADLTLVIRSAAERGLLSGIDASLTVQNLFNAKPHLIATTLPSDAPYDSTNYSPVGRFIAASLRKKW